MHGGAAGRLHQPAGRPHLLPRTAAHLLQVRGPTTLSRYYKAAAPATDAAGWFDTGDVAHIDEYGHMQVGACRRAGPRRHRMHSAACQQMLAAQHCPLPLPITTPDCHCLCHCPTLPHTATAPHLQITDRSKDVIKSGGEWISSIEIENAAVGHPQVAGAPVPAGGG